MDSEQRIQALVEKAKGGDRDAFDQLMEVCSQRQAALIHTMLKGSLKRKTEADDLLQEVFLNAWQSIEEFQWQGEEPFWAWLDTITRNVVRAEGRRISSKKRSPDMEVSLAANVPHPNGKFTELVDLLKASQVTPSRIMRRDARFERLRLSLKQLSPDHRTVIFLVRVRGLPLKEVAERMDRSKEAVSLLLFRALIKLKEAFGATESLGLPDRSLEEEGNGDAD